MKFYVLSWKIPFICLIIIFVPFSSLLSQPNWTWAAAGGKGVNSYSVSQGTGIAIDQNDNTYVVGGMSSPAKIGNLVLNSYGFSDIFIAKYDTLGNPIWAKTAGGPNNDMAKSITLGSDGYIYVCGYFVGLAHFGNITISEPSNCYFVSKLDTNGNFIWVKYGANGSLAQSNFLEPTVTLTADDSNHIYFSGFCKNNAELIDTVYTSSSNKTAFFIAQLDTSGHMNWTHFIRNRSYSFAGNLGVNLAIDSGENLIYSAIRSCEDTVINGPSSTTNYGNLITGKLTSNGNVIWEKEFGDSTHFNWTGTPLGMTLDENENIYVNGFYVKQFILNPSTNYSNGGFYAKFSPIDGSVLASQRYTATNGTTPAFTGCDYDLNGNILHSGRYSGTIDFGGITIQPIVPQNVSDCFVASYDTSGNVNYVVCYGNNQNDVIVGSTINNHMYAVTGYFGDSISFGPHHLVADNLTTNSFFMFIAVERNNEPTGGITIPNTDVFFKFYPNPAVTYIAVETKNPISDYEIDIFSTELKYAKHIEEVNSNKIDVSDLPPGTYYISLQDTHVQVIKKFVKLN